LRYQTESASVRDPPRAGKAAAGSDRFDPRNFAPHFYLAVELVRFVAQLVHAHHAQQRAHGEGDLAVGSIDIADDGDRAVADEAEGAFDGELRSLMEPARERIESEEGEIGVAFRIDRAAIDLSRDSDRLRVDGDVLLAARHEHPAAAGRRNRRHVPSVIAARPRACHRSAGESAEPVGLEPLEGQTAVSRRDFIRLPRQGMRSSERSSARRPARQPTIRGTSRQNFPNFRRGQASRLWRAVFRRSRRSVWARTPDIAVIEFTGLMAPEGSQDEKWNRFATRIEATPVRTPGRSRSGRIP
jgi:hypothetical protein